MSQILQLVSTNTFVAEALCVTAFPVSSSSVFLSSGLIHVYNNGLLQVLNTSVDSLPLRPLPVPKTIIMTLSADMMTLNFLELESQ